LCCSTWLTEFKSVNTAAARYQNLAINQTKLSGMCGRLKCCLNYELDTYIDALEDFPDRAERLKTQAGLAILVKTDVFKRIMFYTYAEDRGKFFAIHVDQIWEALDMIKSGRLPASLDDILAMAPQAEEEHEEAEPDFENVHDVIQLPMEKRKKKKKKKKNREGSAAAAVEKAAAQDAAAQRGPSHGRPSGDRRDQRRPDQRTQGRPDQKQQERSPQKPPHGQGGGGQNQGQRPPQQGKPDSRNQDRPPQNKPDQRPPQERPPNQQGGNNKKQGPPRPPQQGKPDQNNK
jgi:hypothetical protein